MLRVSGIQPRNTTLQGQQLTFTGDVLMSGNYYYGLQNGGDHASRKQPGGQP